MQIIFRPAVPRSPKPNEDKSKHIFASQFIDTLNSLKQSLELFFSKKRLVKLNVLSFLSIWLQQQLKL